MNENNNMSKLEQYGRFILRILSCIFIGLISNVILAILFFLWCISLFGSFTYHTSQVFSFIFINAGLFLGTLLAGWLSNSLKRSIITTVPIAVVLGIILIIVSGTLIGIINIIVIMVGGLLGGYITEKNVFDDSK